MMTRTDPYRCTHPQKELRRRTYPNDVVHFVDQCLECGAQLTAHKRDSNTVAQAKLQGEVPQFDDGLRDNFFYRIRTERHKKLTSGSAQWKAWYTEYLKSDQWKAKRTDVMRRDNFTCQGCLCRATEIHHLSYDNAGDELLFQLVAICRDCHEKIHESKEAL